MMRRRVFAVLLALLVGAVGCSGSGAVGGALARGWAMASAGVRLSGLCDERPPPIVRAIVEADRAEAESLDGGASDASPVSDASGAELSTISGDR